MLSFQEFTSDPIYLKGNDVFHRTQDMAFYGRDDVEGYYYADQIFIEYDRSVSEYCITIGFEIIYGDKGDLEKRAYDLYLGVSQ
jgi:hypothetical protein